MKRLSEQEFDTLSAQNGLRFACLLDGSGGGQIGGWADVTDWVESGPMLWAHMDRSSERVHTWLRENSGIPADAVSALLAEETRPRVFDTDGGTVAILRGVNTNPGADPEDMVAVRMWCDGKRLITLRYHKLVSPEDVLRRILVHQDGPKSIPQTFDHLICRLNERMAPTISAIEEQVDDLEAALDISMATTQRQDLTQLRQNAVLLRRYIAPQREALNMLLVRPPEWLDEQSHAHFRDTADRLQRYLEELDATRERALVLKDDLTNQLAESSNKTLYVLAIISAIFLPLGFLTGLMGINIGGMPGVDHPYAFWVFCGVMVGLLIFEIVLFRKLRWL